MVSVRQLLAMPDRRKPIRFRRKRPRYKTEKPRSIGREELIAFLRDNKVTTMRQLEDTRKAGQPRAYDYQKEFGSWSEAKVEAFGHSPEINDRVTEDFLYSVAIQYDVWCRDKWLRVRRRFPDIFPSTYHVVKLFGSWREFWKRARKVSLKRALEDYMALKRKLGKTPTMRECEHFGVSLDEALRHFAGKCDLDRFVRDLEGVKNEDRTRDT